MAALILTALLALGACRENKQEAKQEIPSKPPAAPALEYTGPDQGWPPRVKGASDVRLVPWEEIPGSVTEALEGELRQTALQDPRVRQELGERFAYLSADEIEGEAKEQKRDPARPLAVRLTFFSHSHNTAVQVTMRGRVVETVARRLGDQPPEGPDEIKVAIALAQRDARLRGKLQGLAGNALVAFPTEGEPGYGHRVLDVTFTKEGQDLPSYFALVDLTEQKVLTAGPITARGRK